MRSGLSFVWLKKWGLAIVLLLFAVGFGLYLYRNATIDFDTFLNDAALGLLLFVLITLFYGIIAIHDIPYEIAKARDHPQQDAIHAAGWVSLFTLHAIWPFLWIWAMIYRPDRGWGFGATASDADGFLQRIDDLVHRVEALEARVAAAPPRPDFIGRVNDFETREAQIRDRRERAQREAVDQAGRGAA